MGTMSGYTRGTRHKVAKDRAAPFSRKHRRYWLTITGGMILIGAINLGLGFCGYEEPSGPPEKIERVLPVAQFARDGGLPADATAPAGSAATPR